MARCDGAAYVKKGELFSSVRQMRCDVMTELNQAVSRRVLKKERDGRWLGDVDVEEG